ncbi:hypothetical protein FH972_021566 [Carpinus fangiana]|uniref:L-2-hydroxyglutarate dehydrogenase, mitochondrial n=1 Tax=Carpinus fangiana TaxID=176857 RepID=A0A5N6KQ27_9ROSI|nr:hypothetical protein FH972_021566 [Carpinus fangiana]
MPPTISPPLLHLPFHTTRARLFSTTAPSRATDFTHIVLGAGAVGLACARRLAAQPGTTTLLLERHRHPGTETSSRNSEVIHAGLYYGATSLKTRLCIEGKRRLYAYCERKRVPHRRTGKWVVSQTPEQAAEVEKVHRFARDVLGRDEEGAWLAPTRWLTAEEVETREPAVRAAAGALESTSTGILDSHAYMQALLGDFEEQGGTTAFASPVVRVEALGRSGGTGAADGSVGWRVWTSDDEADCVTAEVLVNSAGLGAVDVHNMIVPEERRRKAYFAKGNYYSYSASAPKVGTLIYPAPVPGHGGLGTHLTLDMGGRVRFGPDVEYVDSPDDLSVSGNGLAQALDDIAAYLPGLEREAVGLDYCGIRPKLSGQGSVTGGKGFVDFYIKKEDGYHGWVNLMGIESPGLTSSLAIGEEVGRLLYESGHAEPQALDRQQEGKDAASQSED